MYRNVHFLAMASLAVLVEQPFYFAGISGNRLMKLPFT